MEDFFRVSLTVNFTTVPYSHYPDNQLSIFDFTDQAVISDAVSPLLVVPLKRLAAEAWIIRCLYLVDKSQNALLDGFIQPLDAFPRCVRIAGFIAQA